MVKDITVPPQLSLDQYNDDMDQDIAEDIIVLSIGKRKRQAIKEEYSNKYRKEGDLD